MQPRLTIIAQAAAFLIYGFDPDPADRSLLCSRDIRQDRFLILAKAKARILSELDLFGVRVSTLFPEIDKAAEFIKSRYMAQP